MQFLGRACLAAAGATFSAQAPAQDIYTCMDAAGRRLTADRPILECIDREQRVLKPSGTVHRTLGPSYTAAERAALEEKRRNETEQHKRLDEQRQRQRQRALLARYPSPEVFERERAAALAMLDDVITTAHERSANLLAERRRLENEATRYAGEPARMPPMLKPSQEVNSEQLRAQERFIADQEEERRRVTERFRQMRQQLDALWSAQREANAH